MVLSQTDTAGTLYFLPDAQGSTRALADSNGALGQTYHYDAFGNLQGDYQNGLDTNYLYTGQQYDVISELYSLRARYYDASIGRFLSRDTWAYDFGNPIELNRYVYTANNPATMVDPTGYMGFFSFAARIIDSINSSRPLRTFMGGFVGASFGAIIGGLHAALTYRGINHGMCGSRMLPGDREAFIRSGIKTGALFGAITGAAIAFSPTAKIIAGSVTTLAGLGGFIGAGVEFGNDLLKGDFNSCAALDGSLSVLAVFFGTKMIDEGLAWEINSAFKGTLDDGTAPYEPTNTSQATNTPDFYVTPDGEAIPSTAYKYVGDDWRFLQSAIDNGSLPADPKGTYVTFDGNYTPAQAQSALQLPMEDGVYVSNAKIRIEFDTLQFIDNIKIPDGLHGTNGIPEPLCCTYSDWGWGAGGGTQATTTSPINISRIVNIVTGAILYESP